MLKEQLLLEKKVYELTCQLLELTAIHNQGDDSQSLTDLRWQIHAEVQELEAKRMVLANQAWPISRKQEWHRAVTA